MVRVHLALSVWAKQHRHTDDALVAWKNLRSQQVISSPNDEWYHSISEDNDRSIVCKTWQFETSVWHLSCQKTLSCILILFTLKPKIRLRWGFVPWSNLAIRRKFQTQVWISMGSGRVLGLGFCFTAEMWGGPGQWLGLTFARYLSADDSLPHFQHRNLSLPQSPSSFTSHSPSSFAQMLGLFTAYTTKH